MGINLLARENAFIFMIFAFLTKSLTLNDIAVS